MEKIKKAYHITLALYILGALLLIIAYIEALPPVFYAVGLLVFALSLFIGFKGMRCPHCGKPINTRWEIPSYCPGCGKKIQ